MGALMDAAGLDPLQTLRAIAAWMKSKDEDDFAGVKAAAEEAAENALKKVRARIARLKNEAKKQGALADKVGVLQKIQDAERLQRTMRNQIFDVEDAIKAALSQKDASVMRDFSSTFPEAVAIVEKALSGRSGAEVDAKQGGHEPSSPQMVTVPQITGKIGPTTFPEHPDFKTYDEVQEWIAKRSSEVGLSKKSFAATHEYSHALPKIEAVYKAAKTQFDENQKERGEDALRQMADVGVKVGDTVAWTKIGAFLSQESYQGVVVMRGGIPHVKLADKITVSSSGKLRQTNYLPWKPYMLPKASANQSSVKNSDSATAVPIIKGRHNPVKTAKGTRVDTVLALVEANSLIMSHDPASGNENPAFPQELQPRDRGRDSSIQWVQKVAASLDPDSLGRTSRADTGAPIIGPDHVVESGNGRSMAVKLAYQRGTADDYRQWLVDEAGYFGFTPEQVESMRQPVLVRLRTSDIDRKAFVVEANQDDKLTFTATERAKTDAKRLDSHLLGRFSPSEDGDVTAASNQRFVQGFLQSLGDTEAAQYLTKDGKPTVALVHRLRAAVFSKAYNDDRLLEMMADQTKPEIQNVLNALSAAAPRFIDAQGYSRAGTEDVASGLVDGIEQSLDQRVVDAIVQATNTLMAARSQQQDVAEYVKQLGMFEDLPEGVPELAVFLAQNSRSAKRMAIAFKAMADFVKQDAISQQSDNLFGDPEPPRMADVVAAANAAIEREYGPEDGGMIGLFDSAASMTPLQTLRAILEWTKGRDQEAVHTAIQAYVASWQKQADQINAALAEFDWSQIKDSNSAQNAYLSLAEQVKTRGGNSLIDAAMSRLEQIGVSRWDNRLPDMGSTDAAKALHEASDAAREALGNILALGKQKDKELGKRALSNLEPDATPMDIAKAIFMKNGVQLGQSESPEFLKQLLEDIENKNADRLSRTLLNGLNKASIEVFEKLTGVKLVGKQALRMAAIDQWAGVTPEERAHRNLERQESMANARIARELESSWQGLEGIKVGTDKGVVTAQQWVLQCLEEGYTQPVRSSKPGVAQGYVLENPETGLFTRLKTTKFNDFIKAVIKSGGMNRAIKLLGLPTQAVPDQSEELTNVASDADLEHLFGKSPGQMFDSASMTPVQTLRAIMAWLQTRNTVGRDDGLSDRYTDENYRYKDVAPDGSAEQAIRDAFEALPRVTLGEAYPITVQHNGRKQQFLASQRALKRSNRSHAALTLLQVRKGRLIAGDDLQYIAHIYKLSGENELTEANVTLASDELIKRWNEAFLPAADQVKPEAQQAPAKPEAAEPFEHAGLKISPYRHRAGGEIKDGWIVQTPENAEREARGERQIGGDSIYSSREEAILAADREADDWEDRKRLQQEQNEAEKVEREAMLARKEAVKGLTLSQIKKYDYLNEMVSYQGRPMTRRSYVEMLVSEGNEPNTFEESVIKPMSNRQFNRASAAEQRAHEQKMKRAGMKTVYCIGDYIVSKTLYEYAVEFSQRGGGDRVPK